MRVLLVLLFVASGCAGGNVYREIDSARFPRGDYEPSAASAGGDLAEAFQSCRELEVGGYRCRLREVEAQPESLRISCATPHGDERSARYELADPLPRLDDRKVRFPPFYSSWDITTHYRGEVEASCLSPNSGRRLIDAVAGLRAVALKRAP